MRIALVHALPFHRWILADVGAALREAGHEVVAVDHDPAHGHDWLSGPGGEPARLALRSLRADLVVAADYPYAMLREAARAPVVGTRHSLAARGNTWAPEQAEADALVTFGEWDERLLAERRVSPRDRTVLAGCPWADRLLRGDHDEARAALLDRLRVGPKDKKKKIVALAPTWNAGWSPTRELGAWAAKRDDLVVVLRPHWATSRREPGRVTEIVEASGGRVLLDDPLAHPAGLLLGADLLVGDVSGIGLLAMAVPGAALPVVQFEPPTGAGGIAQMEPWGPEWTLRDAVGPRVRTVDDLDAWVDALVRSGDAWSANRQYARRWLFGPAPLADGGACARLAALLSASP